MSNPQVIFLDNDMQTITVVLHSCQQSKKDCACGIQVTYLKDRTDLPEAKRYKTSVYCGDSTSKFYISLDKKSSSDE